MKTPITRDHVDAIASALGVKWRGDTLCLADWGRVLESAYFEGLDIDEAMANINADLPSDAERLKLIPLVDQQEICDQIDQYIPGGNHRAWFENERRLVQVALSKVKTLQTRPH
jgi:hypothetical protein